jgi:hypothetical protein
MLTFLRLTTIKPNWRYIYYVAIALIGATLILAFFAFPETNYIRPIEVDSEGMPTTVDEKLTADSHVEAGSSSVPAYIQRLKDILRSLHKRNILEAFLVPHPLNPSSPHPLALTRPIPNHRFHRSRHIQRSKRLQRNL